MRHELTKAWPALALTIAAAFALVMAPAAASSASGHDASRQGLQEQVDRLVGSGHVDVHSDFIGARAGDPSPWCWANDGHVVALTLIDRDSPHGSIGWYEETGRLPVLDGVGDGVVLEDLRHRGARTIVRLPSSVKHYGFYISPRQGDDMEDDGRVASLFTNNLLNGLGPHGEEEDGGRAGGQQVLVFDVSRWLGSDTWLVASPSPAAGSSGNGDDCVKRSDGDDDDGAAAILFTVTGQRVTPAHTTNFARVKALFR